MKLTFKQWKEEKKKRHKAKKLRREFRKALGIQLNPLEVASINRAERANRPKKPMSPKVIFRRKNHNYDILRTMTLEEGFEHIRQNMNGKRVRALLTLGIKSTKCVNPNCKKEGSKFAFGKGKYNSGIHLDMYCEDDTMMTIDHIIPKSKGGPNDISNYQLMCKICNEIKGNKIDTITEPSSKEKVL